MKRIILLVAASLVLDVVAANTVEGKLYDDVVLVFKQGQSRDLGRQGVYNYSTDSRVKSIGIIRNIRLTPTISAGFGLMFGGIELEFETQPSMVRSGDLDIDIDRLLGINAKIKFANIVPYSNLSYFIEDRKQRLNFSANFGIEVVQLSGVSVDLEGEVGELLMQQEGVVSKLQEEIRNELEVHYLVPVIQMNLNYLFN